MKTFIRLSLAIALTITSRTQAQVRDDGQSTSVLSLLGIQDHQKDLSDLLLIDNGGESLVARLWLIDHAKKTIDIQYYSIGKDITGTAVWDHLLNAADRGVKIRILLDDAASQTYGHLIQLIDSHPNIEIRIYNGGIKLGRIHYRLLEFGKNYNRLLRRMHNKTFTVDEQISICGGRNISDEYFDYDDDYNFRDRDLMLIGKPASEVVRSFNTFWENQITIKYEDIAGKQIRRKAKDPHRFDKLHRRANDATKFTLETRKKIDNFPQFFTQVGKEGYLFRTVKTEFIFDAPVGKAGSGEGNRSSCADTIVALIRSAKKTIDIQSPYVILSEKIQNAISDAKERGVNVRILTNSLASIDNFEPFAGYQKCRSLLFCSGISLYEFRPDAAERAKQMSADKLPVLKYKGTYGFHVKSMIVDNATAMVGSFNFDPRSEYYNTECISVSRSTEFSSLLTRIFENETLPENSWKVTKPSEFDRKAKLIKRIKTLLWWPLPKRLV